MEKLTRKEVEERLRKLHGYREAHPMNKFSTDKDIQYCDALLTAWDALEMVLGEIEKHNADYHHRTSNRKIDIIKNILSEVVGDGSG